MSSFGAGPIWYIGNHRGIKGTANCICQVQGWRKQGSVIYSWTETLHSPLILVKKTCYLLKPCTGHIVALAVAPEDKTVMCCVTSDHEFPTVADCLHRAPDSRKAAKRVIPKTHNRCDAVCYWILGGKHKPRGSESESVLWSYFYYHHNLFTTR